MSNKKISARRLTDLSGPRRRKPKLNQLKRETEALIEGERHLLARLVADVDLRRSLARGLELPFEPLRVWTEFDHSSAITELHPRELPKWEQLTEWMKAHLAFQVALEFGVFSFTANLHPDLEQRWVESSRSIDQRIQKRIRGQLEAQGLSDLPYFYVIEGRTRHGKSRSKLHIHGFFAAENPVIATKMKLVLESALRRDELRRIERKHGVKVEHGYDLIDGARGPGRWVSYITKSVMRYEKRLPSARRIFMSTPMTQIARDFWAMVREEPLG